MTFEKVKEVIVDAINCDADKITMEAALQEDLGMDSLDALELNIALEDKIGTQIPDEKLAELKTVGDIVNYIDSQK